MIRILKLVVWAKAFLVATFLSSGTSTGASGAILQPTGNAGVQSHIDGLVQAEMDRWHVPGAVVAVVEKGEVLVLKGYGVANLKRGIQVDPHKTVFHVASLSKPLTATGVLQLAEQDKIDLDQPIDEYLTRLRPDSFVDQSLTAAHLLTHTGGFDRQMIGRKTRRAEDLSNWREYLAANMPPVVRPPGSVSVYSNYGYGVAGLLIEDVSGVPFASYMEENVFSPLGMTRSSFALEPEIEADLATGYGWRGTLEPPVPHDYIRTVPASMLRTTAADMARWMLAILEGGQWKDARILEPASAQSMLSRQFANHDLLPGRSYGLAEGGRFESPEFLHAGGASGFTAALVLHPEVRLGIFVAFNSQGPPWEIIRGVLDSYDEELERRSPPAPLQERFDTTRFAGYYRNSEFPVSGLARIGILFQQQQVTSLDDGQVRWGGTSYVPVETLAFRSADGESLIAFQEMNEGIEYFFRHGGEYELVPWYWAYPTQLALWGTILLIQVAVVLIHGWAVLKRLRRSRPVEQRTAGGRWPLWVVFAAAALNLSFVISLGVVLVGALGGSGLLEYGLPNWLKAVLFVPWITGVLGLLSMFAAAAAWRRDRWNRGERLQLTVASITIVAFAALAMSWNLILLPGL